MANTYTQLYIQIVFAVSGRQNLISNFWKDELCKYICGIINNKNHKPIIVNGYLNHLHCFVGYNPVEPLPDLVRDIKNNSSKFINENNLSESKFNWQRGYGAFSHSRRELDIIYNYILNQEAHHQKESFRDEYIRMLNEFDIAFDERYIFDI
jgi:REP element-mobilizing transposase RayT